MAMLEPCSNKLSDAILDLVGWALECYGWLGSGSRFLSAIACAQCGHQVTHIMITSMAYICVCVCAHTCANAWA